MSSQVKSLCQASNRTSLELKPMLPAKFRQGHSASNRTSLELKRNHTDSIVCYAKGLLIEPVWN